MIEVKPVLVKPLDRPISLADHKIMCRGPDLFHPTLERANLFLPLGFVLVWAGFTAIGHEFQNFNLLGFLTYYVFMDVTHTGFTLVLLALLPEPREMVIDAARRFKPWLVLSVLLLLIFPVFFVGYWSNHLKMDERLGFFALTVLNAIWNQHAISQVFGISLLYNRQMTTVTATEARWERLSFKTLIYLSWLGPVFMYPFFGVPWLFGFSLLVAAVAILTILFMSYRQTQREANHKFVFQLRLLLWAAGTLHPILMSGVMAFHAFEYLCVFQKMYERSHFTKSPIHIYLFWGLSFLLYPALRYFAAIPAGLAFPFLVVWAAAFARSLDFLHYYVDGVIFRFREPEPRRWMAPLL